MNLNTLNRHLFEQLDRLDRELSEDELKYEVSRSRAITDIADNILDSARLTLEAEKFKHSTNPNSQVQKLPEMLEG